MQFYSTMHTFVYFVLHMSMMTTKRVLQVLAIHVHWWWMMWLCVCSPGPCYPCPLMVDDVTVGVLQVLAIHVRWWWMMWLCGCSPGPCYPRPLMMDDVTLCVFSRSLLSMSIDGGWCDSVCVLQVLAIHVRWWWMMWLCVFSRSLLSTSIDGGWCDSVCVLQVLGIHVHWWWMMWLCVLQVLAIHVHWWWMMWLCVFSRSLLSMSVDGGWCDSVCSPGHCYPCPLVVDVTCACGKTKITVPCGAEKSTRPPRCRQPCGLVQSNF